MSSMSYSTETSSPAAEDNSIQTAPEIDAKDSPSPPAKSDDTVKASPKVITVSDRYAAGLLDGEGSFMVTTYRDPHGRRYYVARVQISNTNHHVLECMKLTYGGSVSSHGRKRRRSKIARKWSITGEKMEDLIRRTAPHLIVKKEVARLVYRFQKYRSRKTSTILGQAEYRRRVRKLNKRGD